MNTLIYLTDNIFLERDYERFHIKFLRKKFKIKILDLSKLINHELHELYKDSIFKKEDYLNFSNMNEFKIYMKEFQNSLIIDQLGVTVKTIEVRKFLLKIECKLIKVIVGTLPFPPKKKLLSRAFDHLVLRKNSGKSILKKIIDNLVIHKRKKIIYDFVLYAGDFAYQNDITKSAIHKINVNSYDYDLTLGFDSTKDDFSESNKNYAVFIDNDIIYHPDYKYHGTKSPVSAKEYYENLNRFFDKFERIHNLEIIIAANPKSNYNIKEKFIGRKFYKNKTGQLIKNSNLVFAHSSTAVGFAVIYGKPIINLTSNKLKESWFHQEILYSSKVLKTSLINIDIYNSARDSEKLNIEKYDKNSYETYFKTYIKSNKIENMTSWQIFYSYLIEKNLY